MIFDYAAIFYTGKTFCLPFRTYRKISRKGIKNITRRWRSKTSPSVKQVPLSPFPRKRAPRRLLRGGTSRSRSAGAFSDCVTRFRGGALRHAKFPKTSYKVQLLDTRLHGRCVGQNRSRGRGLIFLSSKVLAPFKQNASVLSGEGHPRTPTCVLQQKFFRSIYCFIFLSML